MNSSMIALGVASVMVCIGMACRAKIGFLQKMLVPVSVIAGVFGFLFMNIIAPYFKLGGVDVKTFSSIVDVLFTFSFISIGLSGSDKKKGRRSQKNSKKSSGSFKGALGMGIIWSMLYGLTAAIGVVVIFAVGKPFNMDSIYGILIPFAFCQGPGQASTFGRIFEYTYGFENAEMVALSFAVVGFIAAFALGVPLAKYGLKKGLAKNKSVINRSVEKGYFKPEEQREPIGKVTTHSGNIETLSLHVAIMGICYLIAIGLAKIISFVPVMGATFSAMLFLWGMIAAYIVKAVMRKLGITYLLNNSFQGKITGWTSDYLVVCAFMGIQMSVIGSWIVPILIECAICAAVTFGICLYFGERLGTDHDFECILGLYGTSTGTTPSGIALLRMVDPRLQTSAATELGTMNIFMIFSTLSSIFITLAGIGTLSLPVVTGSLFIITPVYLILIKIFKVWNKPTFTLKRGKIREDGSGLEENKAAFVQGFLREPDAGTINSMI